MPDTFSRPGVNAGFFPKITTFIANIIRKHYPVVVLVLFSVVLCVRNYKPDTFLTGWDTLHPEFNLQLYFERIVGGVWQEHQSLGAVASQAHVSELSRFLVLVLLDLLLPMSMVRYTYAFLMLVIGPLGLYFFSKCVLEKFTAPKQAKLGAFAAGLYYLLNLGTLQHFYVPLEMFLTHYGYLGWVFFVTVRYLDTPDKKNLLWFILVTFLTSSQAHTPTLFFAFMLNFGAFLILYVLMGAVLEKKFVQSLKSALVIGVITLVVNLYWLMPSMYFAYYHSAEIRESKIHQLFSQEAFLQNREFGDLKDVVIIKNFLFNWGEHVGGAEFGSLLNEWNDYHKTSQAIYVGYVFFALIVLGIIVGTSRKASSYVPVFGVFMVSIFFLFNDNPPFGGLFQYLQEALPLFREAFRFPFTKFSITLMFAYAVYFGVFWASLADIIAKALGEKLVRVSNLVRLIFYTIVTASLVYFMLPAFSGFLISPSMKVKIPDRYFVMFDYLNKQNDYGRVMNLPIHSFWGWVYHNWDTTNELGYQGAGFLWFGIKQPLVNREFDRWNIINEQVYRDISLAIYSYDSKALTDYLEKYQIRRIILDESVIAVGQDSKVLQLTQLESLLKGTEGMVLEKDFGDGLYLYNYTPKTEYKALTEATEYYSSAHSLFKESYDPAYILGRYYIKDEFSKFPYAGISTQYEYLKDGVVTENESSVVLGGQGNSTLYATDQLKTFYQYDAVINAGLLQLSPAIKTANYEVISAQIPSTQGKIAGIKSGQTLILYTDKDFGKPLGQLPIYAAGENNLSTYSFDPNVFAIRSDQGVLEACSSPASNSSFSKSALADGFEITARNINACLTVSVKDVLADSPKSNLYVLNLSEKLDTSRSDICVLNSVTGLCINKEIDDFSTYFEVTDSQKIDNLFLRFYVKATGESANVKFKFVNPTLIAGVQTATVKISPQVYDIVDVSGGLSFDRDPSAGGGYAGKLLNNPRICNFPDKEITSQDYTRVGSSLIYSTSSADGVCDSFVFNNAAHNRGYLLEVRAKNFSGIPLRVCLTNELTKRCDIYSTLDANPSSKSYFFVVMPTDEASGYTLNISNISFGSEFSKNELEYVDLIPFPVNLIRGLSSEREFWANEAPADKKLIVYGQSYEKGWLLFCGVIPCNAKHYQVNNWENGWVVDKSVNLTEIRPVFWPEILEILGFLILLVVLAIGFKGVITSKMTSRES